MISGLNKYSAAFAERLFEAFPWLEEHSRITSRPGTNEGDLHVEYYPPPVREDCDLWIITEDYEVILGFGPYHRHFDWPDHTKPNYWSDPFRHLAYLMDDRILVEHRKKRGKWIMSRAFDRGDAPDAEGEEEGSAASTRLAGSSSIQEGCESGVEAEDTVVYIRSWTGAFDRSLVIKDRDGN